MNSTYRVRGIYEITVAIDVDETVEAESEDEAVLLVQDGLTADQGVEQTARWVDAVPDVWEVDGAEES